jgi:hypothetical protein
MDHRTDQPTLEPTPTRPQPNLAQYPTPGGGHVILGDRGPDAPWRYTTQCTGADCPHKDGYRTVDTAHRYAQAHAKKCYEPAVTA